MHSIKWRFKTFKNDSLKKTLSYHPYWQQIFTFPPESQFLKKNNLPLNNLKSNKATNHQTHKLVNQKHKIHSIYKTQAKLMIQEAGRKSSLNIHKLNKKLIKIVKNQLRKCNQQKNIAKTKIVNLS